MKDGLYWVQQLKEQKVSHTELLKDIEKKVQKLNPKINGFVTFDSQEAEATAGHTICWFAISFENVRPRKSGVVSNGRLATF